MWDFLRNALVLLVETLHTHLNTHSTPPKTLDFS